MFFRSLTLENFRNYEAARCVFSKRITSFVGKNGQGKTNILEALSVLGHLSSFRDHNLKNCLRRYDEVVANEAQLRAEVVDADGVSHTLHVTLSRDGKNQHFFNGKMLKSKDYLKHFGLVLFSPQDHELIRSSDSFRRDFIDQIWLNLSSDYYEKLGTWKRILMHRARILKTEVFSAAEKAEKEDQLGLWTERLVLGAPDIILGRMEAMRRLQPVAEAIYRAISGGSETIQCRYHEDAYMNLSETQIHESLRKQLREKENVEQKIRRNLVGPHVEDVCFQLDGADTRYFSSQGQARSLILALKLAHAELMAQSHEKNITPLFIADDIASELDEGRRTFLLNYVESKKYQVFLTAADTRFVPQSEESDIVFVDHATLYAGDSTSHAGAHGY